MRYVWDHDTKSQVHLWNRHDRRFPGSFCGLVLLAFLPPVRIGPRDVCSECRVIATAARKRI